MRRRNIQHKEKGTLGNSEVWEIHHLASEEAGCMKLGRGNQSRGRYRIVNY